MNSRVSTKIQQLLNTLKRPKRPPLSEFFTDDSEEIVEGKLLLQQIPCVCTTKLSESFLFSYSAAARPQHAQA